MKTAIPPQAVDHRRMQAEFDARADAAWKRFLQTGAAVPASEVVAEMRGLLEARRRALRALFMHHSQSQ